MTASAPVPEAGAQTFEVVRFAWSAPDRLELEGRWFGVRGVRFVRPTLVLVAGEEHRRALALLEHNPGPAAPPRPRPGPGAPPNRPGPPAVPPKPRGTAGDQGLIQRAAATERAQQE